MPYTDKVFYPDTRKKMYIPGYKILTENGKAFLLGEGSFAKVFQAVNKKDEIVAIKVIDVKKMKQNNMMTRVRDEIRIHKKLNHPSILKILDDFEDNNFVYLILEFCKFNLSKWCEVEFSSKGELVPEEYVRLILISITHGLIYLQEQNIIHRDLKLANILITPKKKIKIADFGLSTYSNNDNRTIVGTPSTMAPEVKDGLHAQTCKADHFSLGCMLYMLLVGKSPNNDRTDTSTKDVYYPKYLSANAKDLIKMLLEIDPHKRISLDDVLKHAFLRKVQPISDRKPHRSVDSGIGSTTSSLSDRRRIEESRRVRSLDTAPQNLMNEVTYCSLNNDRRYNGINSMEHEAHRPFIRKEINKGAAGCKSLRNRISPSPALPSKRNLSTMDYHNDHRCLAPTLLDHSLHKRCTETSECPVEGARGSCHHSASKSHGCPCGQEPCLDCEPPLTGSRSNSFHSTSPSLSTHRQGKHSDCSHYSTCDVNHCEHKEVCYCKCRPHVEARFNQIEASQQSVPSCHRELIPMTKTLKEVTPPLNTCRLRAIRQRHKDMMFTISSAGQVFVEIIKECNNREEVICVFSANKDGKKGEIFWPRNKVLDVLPTTASDAKKHLRFCYENFPEKYRKMYLLAARFVRIVQSKTSKLVFYSTHAKNILMESLTHFEMQLYQGGKIVRFENNIKFVDVNGRSFDIQDGNDLHPHLGKKASSIWEHFWIVEKECRDLEEDISAREERNEQSLFPVTFGMRPAQNDSPLHSSNKENMSSNFFLNSQSSFSNIPSYDSLGSKNPGSLGDQRKRLHKCYQSKKMSSENFSSQMRQNAF